MTETRVIVACAEHKVHWYLGAEPAKCTDQEHQHRQFEVHRHCDVVVLPDGTQFQAVSFDAMDPYARDRQPDYGLYLDFRWRPSWVHDHLDWPDFGVPRDSAAVVTALRSLLDRARTGQQVELGCLGGHGRTGTALAILAILTGHAASDAISWVRGNYCPDAVETAGQEAFIMGLRS
ncbi:protein-tyrosine phosphatase family protein [Nonomuraea jiangxiensis]|uniref:Protein-tyrosine phosphatase n=1 Tax=Nonomuraea jiangxiensis TaxID=633440 RepID=A0A1G9FNH3_9ACTN|nr:protein-tyrosine phosphatase family protein [Nonomuraea jiangxiensis]SDK89978.1 Protein-tyrosine phosphatase [Nonomuraea jiangxiensis]